MHRATTQPAPYASVGATEGSPHGPGASRSAALRELQELRETGRAGKLDLRSLSLVDADLSGLDLTGSDLSGADLSRANLVRTTLTRAKLVGTTFFRATLSHADFSGADLSHASLAEAVADHTGFGLACCTGASFVHADLTGATLVQTDLSRADLRMSTLARARLCGAKLHDAALEKADLSGADLSDADVHGAVFDGADLRGSVLRGVHGFHKARWVGIDLRDVDFTGAHHCRRFILDQNYLEEFRCRGPWSEVLYRVWWVTSDCGRSMLRWTLCTLALAFVFAGIYPFVSLDYGEYRTPLSPLYYSIVTLTSLGYGDVVPSSASAQVVVMIEVLAGYFMLGGLLSILSNKIARRAE